MKFKLSGEEVSNLCRTHIETQYGRRTGTLVFDIINRTSGASVTIDVLIDDAGPMPPETPAPKDVGDVEGV